MNIDLAFSRADLRLTLDTLRNAHPGIDYKDAWVYTNDRQCWEFHFKGFYDVVRASNAYDARARGWELWMRKQERIQEEAKASAQSI